jgi:hypothetical protein
MSASAPKLIEWAEHRPPETVREFIRWSKENPIKWFVEDLILEKGIHLLHGLEESFKTMLMLQLHEALTEGGEFLRWRTQGGLRTGIAELEMKQELSGRRFLHVWPGEKVPEIFVLPERGRRRVLTEKNAADRIRVIVDWAGENELDFVSIDSLAKLFPPGNDVSRQDLASDVFSQLQLLPTTLVLAHDRKPSHDAKPVGSNGNAEIVGSGRMSQEPDVVLQVTRPDRRAPVVTLDCGKMREGFKSPPIELYFDTVDFRLHAVHPFLHLLPASRAQLIEQAARRFRWKTRQCDEYIRQLKELPGIETETVNGSSRYVTTLSVVKLCHELEARDEELPEEAVATPNTAPGI